MAELEARHLSNQSIRRGFDRIDSGAFDTLLLPELKVRYEHFENQWNRFASASLQLINAAADEEEAQVHRTLMDETEHMYLQLRGYIRAIISSIKAQLPRATTPAYEQASVQNDLPATTPAGQTNAQNNAQDYEPNQEQLNHDNGSVHNESLSGENGNNYEVRSQASVNDYENEHLSDYDFTPANRRPNRSNLPLRQPNFDNDYDEQDNRRNVLPPVQKPSVQLQPIYISCPNAGQLQNTWGEFDGKLTEWQTFHDCFQAAVHDNKQISNVFKFQHLKKSLKGKAANIFTGWEHTDANYQQAWERLKQTYERKYQLSKQLFRKFFDLPKLDYASGTMLEKFCNTTHTVLSQLRSLGYPVQYYDAIFVHSLHDKLDAGTSKEWELYRTSEMPALKIMLNFIDWQAKALINVQYGEPRASKDTHKRAAQRSEYKTEKRAKTEDEKPSSSSKSEQKRCVMCKENHALHRCSSFLKLTVQARRKVVREKQLCQNCLRDSHFSKDCTWRACLRCNVKHNSLLCSENPKNNNSTIAVAYTKPKKTVAKSKFKRNE